MHKTLKLVYLGMLLVSVGILAWQTMQLYELVENAVNIQSISADYLDMQKKIGITNIVAFTILLIVSLLNFYKNNSKNFVYLTNLVFAVVVLLTYVSVNRSFYSLEGKDAMDSGSFWMMAFIGIFYIAGAIIVSAIGFVTVKNFIKRHPSN